MGRGGREGEREGYTCSHVTVTCYVFQVTHSHMDQFNWALLNIHSQVFPAANTINEFRITQRETMDTESK